MAQAESFMQGVHDKDQTLVRDHDHGDNDDQSSLHSNDTQAGVKNIEAISRSWSKWSLISAYVG